MSLPAMTASAVVLWSSSRTIFAPTSFEPKSSIAWVGMLLTSVWPEMKADSRCESLAKLVMFTSIPFFLKKPFSWAMYHGP